MDGVVAHRLCFEKQMRTTGGKYGGEKVVAGGKLAAMAANAAAGTGAVSPREKSDPPMTPTSPTPVLGIPKPEDHKKELTEAEALEAERLRRATAKAPSGWAEGVAWGSEQEKLKNEFAAKYPGAAAHLAAEDEAKRKAAEEAEARNKAAPAKTWGEAAAESEAQQKLKDLEAAEQQTLAAERDRQAHALAAERDRQAAHEKRQAEEEAAAKRKEEEEERAKAAAAAEHAAAQQAAEQAQAQQAAEQAQAHQAEQPQYHSAEELAAAETARREAVERVGPPSGWGEGMAWRAEQDRLAREFSEKHPEAAALIAEHEKQKEAQKAAAAAAAAQPSYTSDESAAVASAWQAAAAAAEGSVVAAAEGY